MPSLLSMVLSRERDRESDRPRRVANSFMFIYIYVRCVAMCSMTEIDIDDG